MNEFVIGKAWKKETILLLIGDLILLYGIFYVPYHRYAFTWKPLLIASLWVFYTTYKHRKEQIRFDAYGITLEDGTLCKWQNIKLLEYKHLGQWDWSLIVHTKNNMYKNNMAGYNFDSRKLLKYMQINHPDITFNIYAKFFLGGRFESKHIYVPKEVKSEYRQAGKPTHGPATNRQINSEAKSRIADEKVWQVGVSKAKTGMKKAGLDAAFGTANTLSNHKINDLRDE